jgi:hypothetical protein
MKKQLYERRWRDVRRGTGDLPQLVYPQYELPRTRYHPKIAWKQNARLRAFLRAKKVQLGELFMRYTCERREQIKRCMAITAYIELENAYAKSFCKVCDRQIGEISQEEYWRKSVRALLGLCLACEETLFPFKI